MITSPLHPPGYIPCASPVHPLTSPLHPLYTHTPHTPQGVAPPTAGACPIRNKVFVTPLGDPKNLTDVNASRVPALACGWREPLLYWYHVAGWVCAALFCNVVSDAKINEDNACRNLLAFNRARDTTSGGFSRFCCAVIVQGATRTSDILRTWHVHRVARACVR